MFNNIPPITRNIIILNIIVYLAANFIPGDFLYNTLSAYYPFSPNFKIWQIISHMFMHAPFGAGVGITHILFNMFTLWSFGTVLEKTLGDKRYLLLYFLSGIGAFLLFNFWNFYEIQNIAKVIESQGINVAEIYKKSEIGYPGDMSVFKNPYAMQLGRMLNGQMMGASGAIFGVVAAFATLFPEAKLIFLFIPFPIKAKVLLPIIIVVSIFLGINENVGGIAHFAHVGGAIVGWLLARNWKNYFQRFGPQ